MYPVWKNLQKHERQARQRIDDRYIDPYSSMSGEALWYVDAHGSAMVIAKPKSWLLRRLAGPL